MAQWYGQYTGNSHSTKVKDLEEMLIHAVNVYRESSNEEKVTKLKAINKIAEKLLTARLKLLKAKLYDVEPVIAEKKENQSVQIKHLQEKIFNVQNAGLNGILEEFGFQNSVE
jgi:hypothetical protein